ncbi:MAG: Mur ligase family protein, partial [Rhodoglobus sp.]|nr:Mur ligase family protein [Rhodoglobus sp.]
NRIAPGFLAHALGSFPSGLIVVSGSSGKSTTTKMLVAVLAAHGWNVFTNPSTANIAQGLTSALLERVSLYGRVDAQIAVLEVDEGHGALIAPTIAPRVAVLTNVMVDQIDRFQESEQVVRMLARIAERATDAVVSNADDAMLRSLASELRPEVKLIEYGVSDTVLAASPRGLGYTSQSADRLASGTIVRTSAGRTATLEHHGALGEVRLPAKGVHYAVDVAAAIAAAAVILGDDFDLELALDSVGAMPPVFARGQISEVRGEPVEFILVQNPASFQLNVDELDPTLEQLFMAVGSDVRDPSYLWPVDLSGMPAVGMVSGSKAQELARQLAYQGVPVDTVEPALTTALDRFFDLPAPANGIKTVIFTADSMRRTRTHLGMT